MNKQKKNSPWLWSMFVGVLSILLIINLVVPDRKVSLVENRPLAGWPAFNGEKIADGRYYTELEDHAADQFVGRDLLFHINYLVRKLAGQREIDGVYLGHGALLQEPAAQKENMTQAINTFAAASGIPCATLIAPDAALVQADKLPAFAPKSKENAVLDSFYATLQTGNVDLRPVFNEHKDEYLYYKTDHHWTSRGAALGAQSLLAAFGKEMNLDDFGFLPVSDSFKGTLASRTGSVLLKDEIDICPAKNEPEYVVTWNDGTKTSSIYNRKALETKDQYQVFLGANQGLVQINTLSESTDNLLVFKDSYANSMIQFLLPYYRNIYIVDPRYYYEDISYLVHTENITQIAFVFSYNTFVTDGSLASCLASFVSEQPVS